MSTPRAPTAQELDRFVATTPELPWLAVCWIETDGAGQEQLRWATDREAAPACARTHLLAGRRRAPRLTRRETFAARASRDRVLRRLTA